MLRPVLHMPAIALVYTLVLRKHRVTGASGIPGGHMHQRMVMAAPLGKGLVAAYWNTHYTAGVACHSTAHAWHVAVALAHDAGLHRSHMQERDMDDGPQEHHQVLQHASPLDAMVQELEVGLALVQVLVQAPCQCLPFVIVKASSVERAPP